jgi:hypothetical protein
LNGPDPSEIRKVCLPLAGAFTGPAFAHVCVYLNERKPRLSRLSSPIPLRVALVSVALKSTTHPRRKVTNAFKRRGARVFRTNGSFLNYTINWPRRTGVYDAPEIPFYDRVEA